MRPVRKGKRKVIYDDSDSESPSAEAIEPGSDAHAQRASDGAMLQGVQPAAATQAERAGGPEPSAPKPTTKRVSFASSSVVFEIPARLSQPPISPRTATIAVGEDDSPPPIANPSVRGGLVFIGDDALDPAPLPLLPPAASAPAAASAPPQPRIVIGDEADPAPAASSATTLPAAQPTASGGVASSGEGESAPADGMQADPSAVNARAEQPAASALTWEEQRDAADVERLAAKLMRAMPPEWREQLMAYGQEPALPLHKRIARTRKRIVAKWSSGQLSATIRAVEHLSRYCSDEGVPLADIRAKDVMLDAMQEYDESAQAAAAERARKRAEKGLPPSKRCRGGRTATMPIYYGACNLSKLGISVAAPDPDVKEVARAGPGMPTVQPMMNLSSVEALEDASADASRSEFERAYAGGGWLTAGGGMRGIDLQRTPLIRFETAEILGKHTRIACGRARRSKAGRRIDMRPLAWRAPLIPIGKKSCLDLEPLVSSMPASGEGCGFRDFATPDGMPHSIVHATAWLDKPAAYETIVTSLRDLTGQTDLGTHNGRHVLAEVGRALEFPKHKREHLCYWREQPIIGDANDQRAVDRAITKARQRHTRTSAISSLADLYSSVDMETIECDNLRAACLLACRDAMQEWHQSAEGVPDTTREQLEFIHARR